MASIGKVGKIGKNRQAVSCLDFMGDADMFVWFVFNVGFLRIHDNELLIENATLHLDLIHNYGNTQYYMHSALL